MSKYKKGNVVKGIVTGITSYGVFVSFDEYYSGLVHISEISHNFVKDINDYVKVGDYIYAEILDVDEESSHLRLSIKDVIYNKNGYIKRKKIIETKSGFKTLKKMLPIWIENSLKKTRKLAKKV